MSGWVESAFKVTNITIIDCERDMFRKETLLVTCEQEFIKHRLFRKPKMKYNEMQFICKSFLGGAEKNGVMEVMDFPNGEMSIWEMKVKVMNAVKAYYLMKKLES